MRGRVVSVTQDLKGNIMVTVNYYNSNGELVYVGNPRYSMSVSKSYAELKSAVEKEIKDVCAVVIRNINQDVFLGYVRQKNTDAIDPLKTLLVGIEGTNDVFVTEQGDERLTYNEAGLVKKEKLP